MGFLILPVLRLDIQPSHSKATLIMNHGVRTKTNPFYHYQSFVVFKDSIHAFLCCFETFSKGFLQIYRHKSDFSNVISAKSGKTSFVSKMNTFFVEI